MYLAFILLGLSPLALATHINDSIPQEIRPIVEFMAISSGDARMISQSKSKSAVECIEDARVLNSSLQIPSKTEQGKWQFSVLTSITGPKNSFAKDFKKVDPSLKEEMDEIIKTKFDSHDQRMTAVSNMCQGKSEVERIQLVSHLGGKLSDIYDNDRVSGQKVHTQDQWEALYQRTSTNKNAVAGVCREASLTVSQFLVNCGFSKDQLSIQSYSSTGSGHQVVC